MLPPLVELSGLLHDDLAVHPGFVVTRNEALNQLYLRSGRLPQPLSAEEVVVSDGFAKAQLSKLEAAELLGVNERTLRRWCRRYEDEGEAGLADRRLGKPSLKRVPAAEAGLRRAELAQ
jgi:transposase-like protein